MAIRLLVCADWFDPGVRAGGPIRSCMNLTSLLGKSLRIAVITSSCDMGCAEPYRTVVANKWLNWRGYARVRYCSNNFQRLIAFRAALSRFRPDSVYLNSMFSVAGTLWPLLWLWLTRSQVRIVLAPRGMLKPSALARKSWKKRPFLILLRHSGLARKIQFHATSSDEVAEIHRAFGNVAVTHIPNVPSQPLRSLPDRSKSSGTASCCFIGRIHPIKNLLWLLDVLRAVNGQLALTVVGPVEDPVYFVECKKMVSALPANIRVEFAGPVSESEVRSVLIAADALILPTEGENFGHAIFEAFSVGTPVIISDRTIWRNLSTRHAGWDLEFGNREAFRNALEGLVQMPNSEHRSFREGAVREARSFFATNNFAEQFRRLFAGR